MLEFPEQLAEICVARDATLRDVLRAIEVGGQEISFVLDETGVVLGTVTDGDVRRALLSGRGLESPAAGEIMSASFQAVRETGNHRAAALEAMKTHEVQQVPVLDKDGRLVGVHVIEEYLDREPLPNWAVVLAGGKGTRLRPLTEHLPKPMVRVAGRPILERLVMGLVGAGVRRVFLSVNYMKDVVRDHFGDGAGFGCEILYLEEDAPLGTGGPLSLLEDPPTHPLIHLNGDLVGDFQFRRLLHHHESGQHAMTVGVGLHRYTIPFGVVDIDSGRLTRLREKPSHHWWINYGVYAISPEILPLIPKGVQFPITDLVQTCIERGLSVGAMEFDADWNDVGQPEDLAAVRGEL